MTERITTNHYLRRILYTFWIDSNPQCFAIAVYPEFIRDSLR